MPVQLSKRIQGVEPSITLAVSQRAAEMRREGVDIISFGAGEPDFETPKHIKQAAIVGLDQGASKYPPTSGIRPLREAIRDVAKEVHNIDCGLDQILVSSGAKHSLFNLFFSLLDPGDEVIIPKPYWVSYPAMVKLCGARPVFLDARPDSEFILDTDELARKITAKTRAIVLNSPSNPTGAVYSRAVLERVADICLANNVLIIADDIYRQLVYGDCKYASIAGLSKEVAENTVLIDGVSKSYAMTGWRIGWTLGPKELIGAMTKAQGQSTSGANHLAQMAAVQALRGPQECVAEMRTAFDARRKRMTSLLQDIPGVECVTPNGAFYAFPDLSHFLGRQTSEGNTITDDVSLANYLVEKGIALVPGSGFGLPGFARLSYAYSMDDIEEGLQRLRSALLELH